MTTQRKRPFGVSIIALLLLFNGLVAVVQGGLQIYDFYQAEEGRLETETFLRVSEDWTALDWLTLPFTIAGIVLAWGMWTLHPRAWFATMALQGIYLAAALYDYFQGEQVFVQMLLSVATVFYLNLRDVQVMFHIPGEREPQEAG
ncbi:MAG: hypothetical protein GXY36_19975 [Chloroflexi bacterium]|jgi:hypothetical protein|nr:hypothetical protein [Chloroflexota bacterium]